jgi:GNAT superfamily N-acetyltransferase
MKITISETKDINIDDILVLYKANEWSSADKPTQLYNGLLNSETLITALHDTKLVGLGNAISDGHLTVYYPHLLVLPEYKGKGIGKMIVEKMQEKYNHFHMQMLTADGKAVDFYKKKTVLNVLETQNQCGFIKEMNTKNNNFIKLK